MDHTVTGIKADGTRQELHKGSKLVEARAEFKKALQQTGQFASIHLQGPDGLDFRQATHKPKPAKSTPPPAPNP